MANYQIEFFGWCHTNGHDKVWGWISIDEDSKLINFWGQRDKPYTFKRYPPPEASNGMSRARLRAICRTKTRPGRRNGTYEAIDPADVPRIVPDFTKAFEHQLTMALLFDNFHGEPGPSDG